MYNKKLLFSTGRSPKAKKNCPNCNIVQFSQIVTIINCFPSSDFLYLFRNFKSRNLDNDENICVSLA